jgi:U3 small nucleolar RNA-associated protein 3
VVVGADGRREAVLRDAPELQNLLEDFAASFNTVQKKTAPLLKELRAGGLGTAEGLSYLETKHTLLLMYCVHSLFYVLLKLEGRPVKDHPVMTRLVESKAFLEKLRPIDKRLKPQIEKLLRAAEVAEQGGPAQPTAGAFLPLKSPEDFFVGSFATRNSFRFHAHVDWRQVVCQAQAGGDDHQAPVRVSLKSPNDFFFI